MAFPVTLNGRTYTLTDFEGTNYVDGLPDAFEDFVTHAGDIYNSTSTTSNSIGTGSKTFTVEANKPYQAGTPLRIADAAAPSTNFLDTVVTSYSGTTLVVNSIGYGGSGTKTSWTVNIGGAKTVDGTLGLSQGGTGATDAAGARTNIDVYSKADADSRFLNVSGESADVTLGGDVTIDSGGSFPLTLSRSSGSQNMSIKYSGSSNDWFVGIDDAAQDYVIGTDVNLSQASTRVARFDYTQGSVDLYYGSGSHRFSTTNEGIDVTGRVLADSLRIDGNSGFYTPSAGTLEIIGYGGASVELKSTGKIKFNSNDSGGGFEFRKQDVTQIEMTSAGNLDMTGAGGNVKVSNGAGIDFSATADGSGTLGSELFDDYEEGSFVPSIPGVTLSTAEGFYRKVGRVVHCWMTFNSSSITDSTSAILQGLPFAAAGNTGAGRGLGTVAYTSGSTDLGLLLQSGTSNIQFRALPGGATQTRTQISGELIWAQFSYASTS